MMNIETPQIAARRLAKTVIAKGFKPEALHAYHDHEGQAAVLADTIKTSANTG